MAFDFLTPVSTTFFEHISRKNNLTMLHKMRIHTENNFPDLDGVRVVIFGVLESRRTPKPKNFNLNYIRGAFYDLFPGNWQIEVADLGDITAGNTVEDTYFAVKNVIIELLNNKTIPVILGGGQDLAYTQYRAYDGIKPMVNLVNIDSHFDLGDAANAISNRSYVGKIILDDPYNLLNYSNLGYQTYFNSQEEIELMESLYFDAYRLGEVAANPELAEPVMRDADLINLDVRAINDESLGGTELASPNGFNGREICALARYAGISDKTTSFGIYELQYIADSKRSGILLAQIIWYFIEGINYRKNEHTISEKNQFIQYHVPINDDILVFYKSKISERWWIELPFFPLVNNKLKKSTLLPCTYQEYLDACNQEIPERWYKARRKNEV